MLLPLDKALSYHIPADAVNYVAALIKQHGVQLRITNQRFTKNGDFIHGVNGCPHRLSINGNLNKYEFLLVFLHEFSHLKVYEQYGKSCKPHGKQWKHIYGTLIRDCIGRGYFPSVLTDPLMTYSYRVRATGVANMAVTAILRDSDDTDSSDAGWKFLEEIPPSAIFKMSNGRVYQKLEKRRTRYKCQCVKTKRYYVIHGGAKVFSLMGVDIVNFDKHLTN